jgi:hypothetical protein
MPNSNWTATCNLFLPSIQSSLPKTIAERQPQIRGKTRRQEFRRILVRQPSLVLPVRFLPDLEDECNQ